MARPVQRDVPEVKFGLLLSDDVANLMHDNVDVAIRFGELPERSLVARRLAPNRRILCASPAYLAIHGTPSQPSDLERFDCIVLGASTTPTVEWRFERDGVNESYLVPVANSADANDGAIARAWAVEGKGFLWDIGADVLAGRLVQVMPE